MVIKNHDENTIIKPPQHFAGPVVKEALLAVHQAVEAGSRKVTFDFSGCELVDSSGIGTLVSVAKEIQSRGATLTLRGLSDDLHQLFFDTGLDKIFTIEKNDLVKHAEIDLFENSVDIRLDIQKENSGDVCIFKMSGVMNHPIGSLYFKQQFLLSLANYKRLVLDFEDLTFFDSLSVSAILNMNKLLKETGGAMRVCGANYIIKDLFSTLNIDSIIPVFNTREDTLINWD